MRRSVNICRILWALACSLSWGQTFEMVRPVDIRALAAPRHMIEPQVVRFVAATSSGPLIGNLAFSPQIETKTLDLWAVAGCPLSPVPIGAIYAIASSHGLTWVTPASAASILSHKTVISRLVRAGGYAAAATASLIGMEIIKANIPIFTGVSALGTLINTLMPLAAKDVPTVDPCAGQPLSLGPDGCGSTCFYAHPSGIGAFVETLASPMVMVQTVN